MRGMKRILIFIFLLFTSNLYLFRPGFWFFQDAGYWPKTGQEAGMMLSQQFHFFSNFGYSLGFDQGLFNFTKILLIGAIVLLFNIFGQNMSQVLFSLLGFIISFISFYLFSGIFFQNKNLRYVISLFYVFNPLSYAFQGYVYFNAVVPLFIYSYYKFFYSTKKLRLIFLLLNIFAAYLWVTYVRFVQGYFIVIFPYIIYLFILHKRKLQLNKLIVFIAFYILLFSPIIYSFTTQILEKSQTAFNYGNIFGNFVVKYKMFEAFNLFQSVGVKLYQGELWSILGILSSAYLIFLLVTFSKEKRSGFYFLNLILVLIGITIYSLGNIFGKDLYLSLIKIFPFVTNEPFWAFYVLAVPIVILIGLITRERIKYLYIYAFLFIAFATLPFLNLSEFQLQKLELSKIPKSYSENFIKPFEGIPGATYYFPSACWRAVYMDKENTPTLCLNFGLRLVSILLDNPRLVSGNTFNLVSSIYGNENINNLRITHNLKNIIVPNDILEKRGPGGPLTSNNDIIAAKMLENSLNKNSLFNSLNNENFNLYSYKDSQLFDFFIYSPKKVIYKDIKEIFDNSLDVKERPVIFKNKVFDLESIQSQNIHTAYKISPLDPTRYFVKLSNIDNSKPFILQFNQSYSSSWKIKMIDKKSYDEIACTDQWQSFTITDNQRCQYNGGLMNFKILNFLNKPNISSNNHYDGNFLSNSWVIFPEDIPQNLKKSSDLYIAVIYDKQIYYTYTIIIAGIALIIMLIWCLIQELLIKITHRA